MRDYDPTTGRYIQADPLGLVDGASVYGYALGNPLVNIDPRGEFLRVIGGAIAGGAASAFVQVGLGMYYGGFSLQEAIDCIDLYPVAVGALFGSGGLGLWGLLKSGQYGTALLSVGNSSMLNRMAPPIYMDEPECGFTIEFLPEWAKALRRLALI